MNRLDDILLQLRQGGPVILLESQSADHPSSQKSLLAGRPDSVIEAFGENITVRQSDGREKKFRADPWQAMKDFRLRYPGTHFGWFGYDLKNHIEKLHSANPDPLRLPDLYFFRPTVLLEADNKTGEISHVLPCGAKGDWPETGNVFQKPVKNNWIETEPLNGGDREAGSKVMREKDHSQPEKTPVLSGRLKIKAGEYESYHWRSYGNGTSPDESPDEIEGIASLEGGISELLPGTEKSDYLKIIQEAKKRIREGDFYEINLSRQLRGKFSGDPFALYRKMRDSGPVPFGAFIMRDDAAVCCASPERFLKKEGATLISEPIKGTSGRGKAGEDEQKLLHRFQKSVKNRAENLMIVDLVRNDLGRIAVTGSVSAEKLFDIQTFSTLHQMVSTIKAHIRDGTDPVDAVRACFPMGSMTGAPKIRVMECIEELENYRRGLYSGAIGYFTDRGDFDFNVVIRTAIIKNGGLFYSTGGAITGDSDPDEEWEETRIKARALIQ